MAETWVVDHATIFDCYTPGQSMPPVRDQWLLCRTEQKWFIKIRLNDVKGELSITSTSEPQLVDGCLVYWCYDEKNIMPLQKNVRTVRITKDERLIDYRLISSDSKTGAVKVEYRVRPE